jgi:ABC-2 type transport system permease protein
VTIRRELRDTSIITRRNLIRYIRLPQLLFFSSVQPIMFLLLFNYVFGGALGTSIHVPGGKYIDYLVPGILVQMVMFGGMQTGIGLADDMSKGIVDRFRSLPMSRAAVVTGRTLSDAIRNVVVILIMLTAGYAIGFRFQDGILSAVELVAVVAIQTMPDWLQAFVRNQPVSLCVNAARQLALGVDGHGAVWKLLAWSIGLLIVFIPLSMAQYRRRAT